MSRKYKYRILKDSYHAAFYIEQKPVGLAGLFEPWKTIKAFYDLNEAKIFCIDKVNLQLKEPGIKIIEVFK